MKTIYANVALLTAALIAGTAVAQAAGNPAAPSAPEKAQAAPANADAGAALLQQHCSTCHALQQVTARSKTADEWTETMDRMVDHGMQITPEDSTKILEYLSAHYGAK